MVANSDGTDRRDLGTGFDPVWSTDSGRLAFTRLRDGSSQVVVIDADGSDSRVVAEGSDPDWSPDGSRIAFTAARDGMVMVVDLESARRRQVTSLPGRAPDWSPDGSRIAFVGFIDGSDEILVVDADGAEQEQLTDSTGEDQGPVWSPDGARIAFTSERDGDLSETSPDSEVYVMNADGSGQFRVSETSGRSSDIVWYPYGDYVAFTNHFWRDYYVYVAATDGSDQWSVTYDARSRDPVWSPDGRNIVFTSTRDGNFEVFVSDPDGGDQQQIVSYPGEGLEAAWSPDGTRAAFTRFKDGFHEIFVANTDGAEPQQLTFSSDSRPVWSPDGARIAFVGDRYREGDPGNNTIDNEIFVMNADGSDQYQLTDTDGHEHGPVWSPDGSRIAFVTQTDLDPSPTVSRSDYQIFVVNADGTGQQQLTKRVGWNHRGPVWSPDGTHIAFNRGRQGTVDVVMVVDADGTDQEYLGRGWGPVWSPDSTRIAFTRTGRNTRIPSIYMVNADGTGLRSLAFGALPAWSPDGSRIAFIDFGDSGFTHEIVVMKPDGTDLRLLSRTGPETIPSWPVWSPDGTRIAFTSAHERRRGGLRGEHGRLRAAADHPQHPFQRRGTRLVTRLIQLDIPGSVRPVTIGSGYSQRTWVGSGASWARKAARESITGSGCSTIMMWPAPSIITSRRSPMLRRSGAAALRGVHHIQ